MTVTYPILNRSRHILWVVTGHDKAEMLVRLLAGDRAIPAGRVNRTEARLLADRTAAGQPVPAPVMDVSP
jgi:6-phosphogluconolactonase